RDVRFSPDDSRIAVGFSGSTKVGVLQASDLASLYAPNTTDLSDGDLSSVAWSADGKTLYAGGTSRDADSQALIRTWADAGRGSHHDIAGAAANAIFHILPLRSG